jgi:hypothetical protein
VSAGIVIVLDKRKMPVSPVRIAASQSQNRHMEPFIHSESIQIEVLSKEGRRATES